MSRILRRPMFRGGKVIDSRGTGITSGLMDGGRVGYQPGGMQVLLGGIYIAHKNFSKFMIGYKDLIRIKLLKSI